MSLDVLELMSPVPRRYRRGLLALLLFGTGALAVGQLSVQRSDLPVAWLAAAPMLASLVLSVRDTAVVAIWALVLGAVLQLATPGRGIPEIIRLVVLVLLCGFAVANCLLRGVAAARLEQVRAVARVAQAAILRDVPAVTLQARFASRYVSAAEEARVGGDLLEVVEGSEHVRWVVGDTRGKGLPAVRLASAALNTFREVAAQPEAGVVEVARAVDATVRREAGEEDFVTAMFCELGRGGWLQVITCGHPPPLLASAHGVRSLSPDVVSPPLGLTADFVRHTYRVESGDRLLFYTDGLLEARNGAGEFFSLQHHVDCLREPDVNDAVEELLQRLRSHVRNRLDDDVALLVVEVLDSAALADSGQLAGSTEEAAVDSSGSAHHR